MIDETLALFKGELTLDDILNKLPKKRLYELREARINRLIEEQKQMENEEKERERAAARNQIMRP